MAASKYPATAMGFRLRSLSESHPENPWATFCIAWARPSTNPTMVALAPSVCVRNTGRTG